MKSPVGIEAILRARAARLARLRRPSETAGAGRTVLTFRLGSTVFALDSALAREVRPHRAVARVPGGTAGLLGIINIRGRLVPLFDLGHVLARAATGERAGGFVIVAVAAGEDIGLRVDAVERMCHVAVTELSPPTPGMPACIEGVTPEGIALLDGNRLLSAVAGGKTDT